MAIDKTLDDLFGQDDFDMGPEGLMVIEEDEGEIVPGESLVTELEDGGIEIDFDPSADVGDIETEFDSNLAEFIEDDELGTIALDLTSKFSADKRSRSDWEQTYKEGLDQLGPKPWSDSRVRRFRRSCPPRVR